MKAKDLTEKSKQMLAMANPEFLGNNNIKIDGNNNSIQINHYTEKPKERIVTKDHQYDPEIHLTTAQQQKIQELVNNIGDMCKDVLAEGHYRCIYKDLNKKFKAPRYSLILQKDFNRVVFHLKQKQMILLDKIRGVNATRYKQYMIPKLEQLWNINKNKIENSKNLTLLICANNITGKNKSDMQNFNTSDLHSVYIWFYQKFIKKVR